MLGQGSYGQVTTVIDIKTGRKYAVKIGEQESLQREVHILNALDHPAFLKVIDSSCIQLHAVLFFDA
jgi:serine/threonine protein kinase